MLSSVSSAKLSWAFLSGIPFAVACNMAAEQTEADNAYDSKSEEIRQSGVDKDAKCYYQSYDTKSDDLDLTFHYCIPPIVVIICFLCKANAQ